MQNKTAHILLNLEQFKDESIPAICREFQTKKTIFGSTMVGTVGKIIKYGASKLAKNGFPKSEVRQQK